MVAIVRLNTEETQLVRHGALRDPTFQQIPLGLFDAFDGPDPGSLPPPDALFSLADPSSVRRRSPRTKIQCLERVVAAQYWNRYSIEIALLIGPTANAKDEGILTSVLLGLARAQAPRRAGSGQTGVRILELSDWWLLPEPITVNDLMLDLPASAARWLRTNSSGLTRPLPPETDAALLRVLRNRIAAFDQVAASLQRPVADRSMKLADQPSLQEIRDAAMTALRLFEADWRDLNPVTAPGTVPENVSTVIATAAENDLINDDVDVFPGWTRHRSQGGWVEFQSRGRRLLVKNVNVSTVESASGADLVYWRSEPDSFVVVQYKKLTFTKAGLVYRIDRRLEHQLRRMLSCTSSDGPGRQAMTPNSYRLGPLSAFVKFAAPLQRHADNELIPGHYLPADLVLLLLEHPGAGARGGKILRIPEGRSMDSEMFVRLVRDCWIGTTESGSSVLHQVMRGLRQHPSAHLTIAYDEPIASRKDQ